MLTWFIPAALLIGQLKSPWAKGQKAKRGMFITTSGFTAQAIDFSRSEEGMALVDGNRLVNLMIDNKVGVTSRLLQLPKRTATIFDEE